MDRSNRRAAFWRAPYVYTSTACAPQSCGGPDAEERPTFPGGLAPRASWFVIESRLSVCSQLHPRRDEQVPRIGHAQAFRGYTRQQACIHRHTQPAVRPHSAICSERQFKRCPFGPSHAEVAHSESSHARLTPDAWGRGLSSLVADLRTLIGIVPDARAIVPGYRTRHHAVPSLVCHTLCEESGSPSPVAECLETSHDRQDEAACHLLAWPAGENQTGRVPP